MSGLYAVLFQIGYYPVSMVTGIALQFLTPIFFRPGRDATDQAPQCRRGPASLAALHGLVAHGDPGSVAWPSWLHAPVFRVFLARSRGRVAAAALMVPTGGVFRRRDR